MHHMHGENPIIYEKESIVSVPCVSQCAVIVVMTSASKKAGGGQLVSCGRLSTLYSTIQAQKRQVYNQLQKYLFSVSERK